LRVDLVGGVTDIPEFARAAGGTSITNLAVDLFADPACRVGLGVGVRLHAAPGRGIDVREAARAHPPDIDLPRAVLSDLVPPSWPRRLVADVRNDLPRRTGLGTSSALAVCLAGAAAALTGSAGGRAAVVARAHHAEVVAAGVEGGLQDFVAAGFGGVNHVTFTDMTPQQLDDHARQLGVAVPADLGAYLDEHLVVVVRNSATVGSADVVREQLRELAGDPATFRHRLAAVRDLNTAAFPLLTRAEGTVAERARALGATMTASWDERRRLSRHAGREALAEIERTARPHCAGLHAPGSGANSMVLLARPGGRAAVVRALGRFGEAITILYVRVNGTGLRVERAA
jgi:galactokinase/mevalonate kinase-like predicted kinase